MSILCPACLSHSSKVFVKKPMDREYFSRRDTDASFMRCINCESLFQDPWPAAGELQEFYGPDYQNYTTTAVPLLAHVDAVYQRQQGAAFTKRFGRDPAVLDFGCGQGGFLRVLAEAGCTQLAGFDFVLYEELVDTSGTKFFDDIEQIRESGMRFDVIRMRHVIEHLTDVDATMIALGGLLKEGGCIVGQTPNAAHYTSRLMGQYWGPLHYPYHTVLFSPSGLSVAAPRWGLRLTATTGPILPTGWALSMENMMKSAFKLKSRGRTAAYTVLMALTMPMALLDSWVTPKATANFDFVLQRD